MKLNNSEYEAINRDIIAFHKMNGITYLQMIDAWHHDYFQMQMQIDEIQ